MANMEDRAIICTYFKSFYRVVLESLAKLVGNDLFSIANGRRPKCFFGYAQVLSNRKWITCKSPAQTAYLVRAVIIDELVKFLLWLVENGPTLAPLLPLVMELHEKLRLKKRMGADLL